MIKRSEGLICLNVLVLSRIEIKRQVKPGFGPVVGQNLRWPPEISCFYVQRWDYGEISVQ